MGQRSYQDWPGRGHHNVQISCKTKEFSAWGFLVDSYTNMFCFKAINVVDKTVEWIEKLEARNIRHSSTLSCYKNNWEVIRSILQYSQISSSRQKSERWYPGHFPVSVNVTFWQRRQACSEVLWGEGRDVLGEDWEESDWPCREQNSVRKQQSVSCFPPRPGPHWPGLYCQTSPRNVLDDTIWDIKTDSRISRLSSRLRGQ